MEVSPPLTAEADVAAPKVEIPQYRLLTILAVWAAAALPMAALAWLVAPVLEDHLGGVERVSMFKALVILLTAGLIWEFVLVVVLVWREQRTLRWPTVREALWLRSPRDPNSGRRGGRLWLIVIPLALLTGVEALIPTPPHADNRDFGDFLSSDAGQHFLSGAWGWFALILVLFLFNTVLGEEPHDLYALRRQSARSRGEERVAVINDEATQSHTPSLAEIPEGRNEASTTSKWPADRPPIR